MLIFVFYSYLVFIVKAPGPILTVGLLLAEKPTVLPGGHIFHYLSVTAFKVHSILRTGIVP